MKIGGAAAIGIGIASVGFGLGLVFVDSKPIGGQPRLDRMLRPTGGALIGVGMLLSTFGAFMLGEAIQRKRARHARFAHTTR